MRSYLEFAWKDLRVQRVTAVLVLIAIVLSALMTAVLGQSIGILQSLRADQAAALNGDRYASFHQLTTEQAELLHRDSRLCDVGDHLTIGSTDLAGSGLTLFLREFHGDALAAYPALGDVTQGRLPEQPDEIALSGDVLAYLGADATVGDGISLTLTIGRMDGSCPDYTYSARFTLTGILKDSYLGYASGTVEGIVGVGTAKAHLPEDYLLCSTDFKTRSGIDFQATVTELAAALGVDEGMVQYNWVLLDALGIPYDGGEDSDTGVGFSFLATACVLVGALVLLAAGLVIYNILKISVARQIRSYGILRAIGGERHQLYLLVALQLLILCTLGIPAGLALGVLSAKGILAAAMGALNPELFLADSSAELSAAIRVSGAADLPALLASAAVTLIFALLAAFPAARYAAHVSPTAAMAGLSVKIRRRIRARRIRSFEAYYARLNLKRGGGRTVITLLSLVMSITVFVALQSFTGLLDASAAVQEMYPGDYAVTSETLGIPEDAADRLRSDPAVAALSTVRLAVFLPGGGDPPPFETNLSLQSHETLQLASVDRQRLLSIASGLGEQDLQAILEGSACLVKNPIAFSYDGAPIPQTSVAPGDTISINGRALRVVGLADSPITVNNDGFVNGVQIIVSDEIYCSAMGDSRYSEIYPTLAAGADPEAFEARLEEWRAGVPGAHWLSYRQAGTEMAESFAQIRLLCWALIALIGAIGILNIINTVYSSIHTRVAEIGMQRAVGMSRASLYRTFLWEGAYYGIFASAIGGLLGYLCSVLTEAAAADALQLTAVPVPSILAAASVSILACLLATAIPLRAISAMDIVTSIECIE